MSVRKRITEYLFEYAEEDPTRPFLTVASGNRNQSMTYGEVAARVTALSRALMARGLQAGDRVATLSTPRPEALLIFLAVVDIGGIWVGLNPKFKSVELRYALEDAEPRFVFHITEYRGRDLTALMKELTAESTIDDVIAIDSPEGADAGLVEFERAGEDQPIDPLDVRRSSVGGRQPAFLVYTSGTTGQPKGALITHHGLSWTYRRQWCRWNIHPMRMICNLPMNHMSGIGETCLTPLAGGGEVLFMEEFDPAGMVDLIAQGKANSLLQIPTMLQMLLKEPGFNAAALPGLKLIVFAGGALPRAAIEKLREFDVRLEAMYGSTESTVAVCYTDPDATVDQLAETVGRPDKALETRLVGREGVVTEVGEPGEIQVRHPAVFAGYFRRETATREVFTDDGFVHTGDIAIQRSDGYLTLVGRTKEMFKSGGYNVYPREIELCLERHPDVHHAIVVPVPDDLYAEVGHAFIVSEGDATAPDPSVLRSWCGEQLANYKIPKVFEMVDELPLLPAQKVDRQTLKDLARKQREAADELERS